MKSLNCRSVFHPFVKMLPGAEITQAGHAGVQLYMYLQFPAQPGGLGRIFQGLGQTGHGLGDVQTDEPGSVLRGSVAQNKDRHGDPSLPQLQGLIQTGHRQIVGPGFLQKSGNPQRPVAVGVSLHHAQKAAAPGQSGTDGLIVVPYIAQAYLRPGSLL